MKIRAILETETMDPNFKESFLNGMAEHVRGDKYVFTDDKGASIRAELDHDRDWSMITKDAPVEIRAEVDKDWTEIELDVLSAKPL